MKLWLSSPPWCPESLTSCPRLSVKVPVYSTQPTQPLVLRKSRFPHDVYMRRPRNTHRIFEVQNRKYANGLWAAKFQEGVPSAESPRRAVGVGNSVSNVTRDSVAKTSGAAFCAQRQRPTKSLCPIYVYVVVPWTNRDREYPGIERKAMLYSGMDKYQRRRHQYN